ncbi:hypothetical protein [Actinomadura hibisca]|uniref:hypothetical protein n=1 Tax=Actinomadura hibisca TaxID=68565 RepID=UPI0008369320|nr:hypothetical protein [Actinomadura hibisca]
MPLPLARTLALAATAATAATAAAPLALSTPAHAAVTTWKVVNPAADGAYTADADGTLTIKNKAGTTLLTCKTIVRQSGNVASKTATGSTLNLGAAIQTVSQGNNGCRRPNGGQAFIIQGLVAGTSGPLNYTATGYDAATGTTTLTGKKSNAHGLMVLSDDCRFSMSDIAATYTNGTRILKYSSAVGTPFTSTNTNGSVGCPGVAAGEAITYGGFDFKVTPAITITRTVA